VGKIKKYRYRVICRSFVYRLRKRVQRFLQDDGVQLRLRLLATKAIRPQPKNWWREQTFCD